TPQAPYRLLTPPVGEHRFCRRCLCPYWGWGCGSLTVARRHTSEHGLPHVLRKRLNGFQSGHRWAVGFGRLRSVKLQLLDHFFCNGSTFDYLVLCIIEVRSLLRSHHNRNSQNFRICILDQYCCFSTIESWPRHHEQADPWHDKYPWE